MLRFIVYIKLLVISFTCVGSSLAQPPPGDCNDFTDFAPRMIGSQGSGGSDFKIVGDWGYWADGDLSIWDVSNPSLPVKVSEISTDGVATEVQIIGDLAYLADKGLTIVDISDPNDPKLLSTVQGLSFSSDLFVADGFAYVLDFEELHIYDVSDPLNPFEVSSVEVNDYARGVSVSGDVAFVSTYGLLFAIDISDKSAPTTVGILDDVGQTFAITINGNYAYLNAQSTYNRDCENCYWFNVIDISNPSSMHEVGAVYLGENLSSYEIVIKDDIAYLGINDWGLILIDVAEPQDPKVLTRGRYRSSDGGRGIALKGNVAIVSGINSGLTSYELPGTPQVGSIQYPAYVSSMIVSEDVAYTSMYPYGPFDPDVSGLVVFDVSDQTKVTPIGQLSNPDWVWVIAKAGDFIYLADRLEATFFVVDVSDPTSPQLVSEIEAPGSIRNAKIIGETMAVGTSAGDLLLYDVSVPSQPRLVSSPGFSSYVSSLEVAGDRFIVSGYKAGTNITRISIVDGSTPTTPVVMGELNWIGSYWLLAVKDSLAYVYAVQARDVFIVDISNPDDMRVVSFFGFFDSTFSGAIVFEIDGNVGYFGGWSDGLLVLDLSDPLHPAVVETVNVPSTLVIAFDESSLYLGVGFGNTHYGSLVSLPKYCHLESPSPVPEFESDFLRLSQNYPNPFNPRTSIKFELRTAGVVSLKVFDVKGRLVDSLVDSEVLSAGVHEVDWDARSRGNGPNSSGVYFYQLTTGQNVETRKMILLK